MTPLDISIAMFLLFRIGARVEPPGKIQVIFSVFSVGWILCAVLHVLVQIWERLG
jgi:hypothetical protein